MFGLQQYSTTVYSAVPQKTVDLNCIAVTA